MRTLALAITFFCSCLFVTAQTFFYIDEIALQPSEPTSTDEVTIDLIGGLSSTGAHISNASATVQGSVISLTIDAMDDGGATVIVPHTESLSLGLLEAGEYIMNEWGEHLDLAPSGQHFFQVTAGDACDLVDIDFIEWSPFSDTAIIVHVFNNSPVLFDYPGFVLLDEDGDTLALETVDLFGIGQESHHTLRIHPGAVIPTEGSMVTLDLWTGFFADQACSWDLFLDLCPPEPCDTLYPTLQNFGGGLTIGDFSWNILDESAAVVGSGVFTLDTLQFDSDTLCLPPGRFTMFCAYLQEPTGGQPFYGVRSEGWLTGPELSVPFNVPAPLEFEFNMPCALGANSIEDNNSSSVLVVQQGPATINVQRTNGLPLGPMRIMDVQGRTVFEAVLSDARSVIGTQGWSSGVYMVSIGNGVDRETFRFPVSR